MLAVSRFAVASGGDENSVPCNGPYRCEDRLTQGQARHFSNGILEAEYIIGYLPFLEMLWSAGGRLCELNRSGLDAPPATRTLEFLTGLHDTNQTHARMLGNPVYAFASFLKGEVAMTAGPSEWLPQTRDASFPVGLAPLPGENGPVSRLGDMVLVVFAKHAPAKREGIIAVLDFLTGPAVQGAEAARLGSMPVRQSLAESAELSPGLREAYAAALAPPFTGVWSAAEFELLNHLGVAYRWLDEKGQAKPLP
jgi:ABC-type glycerol-3-phosphate transport system substrate-binding protein